MGSSKAENTNAEDFPTSVPQSIVDDSRAVTHLTLRTSDASDKWLGTIDITDSSVLALGQTVTIPALMLDIDIDSALIDDDLAERIIRGAILGGIDVAAHYASPGSTGERTANRLTALGDATILAAEWTVTTPIP